MKSVIRTVLAGLTMIALSGIVSASAQAANVFEQTNTACTGGATVNLCYEGTNPKGEAGKWELKGEQAVEVSSLTPVLFKEGVAVTIECPKLKQGEQGIVATQANLSKENAKTSGTLEVEGCSITAPKTEAEDCEIPKSKETALLSGEYMSETDLKLKPNAGVFLAIPFSNKGAHTCALKGTKNITGFQELEILKPGIAEKTKKSRAKETSGLKFIGEEAVSLSGEIEEKYPGLGAEVYVSKVA